VKRWRLLDHPEAIAVIRRWQPAGLDLSVRWEINESDGCYELHIRLLTPRGPRFCGRFFQFVVLEDILKYFTFTEFIRRALSEFDEFVK
jgi:hypothetical protein